MQPGVMLVWINRTIVPVVMLAIALTGCATLYDPDDDQSYRERRLSTARPVYEVFFIGNGYSDPDRMRDFAMLRAAELTLEAGYTHFLVTDSSSWEETQRREGTRKVSVNADATRWPESGDVAVWRMPAYNQRHKTSVVMVDGSDAPAGKAPHLQNAAETFRKLTTKYHLKRATPDATTTPGTE